MVHGWVNAIYTADQVISIHRGWGAAAGGGEACGNGGKGPLGRLSAEG